MIECFFFGFIKNLKASIQENIILNGVNLNIKKGEIHAIMGTNGSGKSTLLRKLNELPNIEIIQEPVDKWLEIKETLATPLGAIRTTD